MEEVKRYGYDENFETDLLKSFREMVPEAVSRIAFALIINLSNARLKLFRKLLKRNGLLNKIASGSLRDDQKFLFHVAKQYGFPTKFTKDELRRKSYLKPHQKSKIKTKLQLDISVIQNGLLDLVEF